MTKSNTTENFDWSCALCLFDKIEEMFSTKPSKRERESYSTWKTEINEYIHQCNKLCKSKIYAQVA